MNSFIITDPLFRDAVAAIDAGDETGLTELIDANPDMLSRRLDRPGGDYFEHPYLLWFVADNPVRHRQLPANIAAITQLIIDKARRHQVASLPEQIDYTLTLVCSGEASRTCGVQIALIDVLIDAGAATAGPLDAAVPHKEVEAMEHLLQRGAVLNLPAAIALDRKEDIFPLLDQAGAEERQAGLAMAAFYGKAQALRQIIAKGVDINAFNPRGYHAHSTALHQAALTGIPDTVKVLVEAGADLEIRDKIFSGTPLGWAVHGRNETTDPTLRQRFKEVLRYLVEKS